MSGYFEDSDEFFENQGLRSKKDIRLAQFDVT